MPELPEAETIARQLHRQLAGRKIGDMAMSRTDILRSGALALDDALKDRVITTVGRRGKRVVLQLDPPGTLVFGLGMSGRLFVCPAEAAVEKHTHLRIAVPERNLELRFRDPRRFGGIWWYDRLPSASSGSPPGDLMGEYGVEPLSCPLKVFRELMARKRQVKALLMDQRRVAGLGNIYCDESLHAARIHPLSLSSRLTPDEASLLLRSIKRVLRRAIRHKGSTLMDYRDADGREGSFQRSHRVYGREGKPCKDCGATIVRIVAAGRSTHLCPMCQRLK